MPKINKSKLNYHEINMVKIIRPNQLWLNYVRLKYLWIK